MNNVKPSIFTLLLLLSIANIAGLLFSPGLPALQQEFHLTAHIAQLTITIYLIGYAIGQLPYGPIANRYGRKKAIYFGLGSAILFSLLSWVAARLQLFNLLLVARFLTALGASVGLMITITIIADSFQKEKASNIMGYMMASFAIMPGLATTVGGLIVDYAGWEFTFLATALYLTFVLFLCFFLPETLEKPKPLNIRHIYQGYLAQFSHLRLVTCGILMGSTTAFVYVYATLAPFITINDMHLSATHFGLLNIIPQLGILIGSFLSGKIKRPALTKIYLGIGLLACGTVIIFFSTAANLLTWPNLFLPMLINLVGTTLIYSNAASLGTVTAADKSNASSVMSFIKMSVAFCAVLLCGLYKGYPAIALSMTFLALFLIIAILTYLVKQELIAD